MELNPNPETSRAPKGTRIYGRRRLVRVAWIAGSVLALAIVITVSAALSAPSRHSSSSAVSATSASDQYAAEANAALEAGDAAKALTLANAALKTDPNNAAAKTVVRRVSLTAKNPAPQPITKPVPSTTPTKSVSSTGSAAALLKMLPASVAGFTLGTPEASANDADTLAEPVDSALRAKLTRAIVAVHDLGTSAKAATFITRTSKRGYPDDATNVAVLGKAAYFGTNGHNAATIVFVKGRYVFETILTTTSGSPKNLLDAASTLARAYRP